MSLILQQFQEAKKVFDRERDSDDGNEVMKKVIALVNDLGQNWNSYNGGELAEKQMKLAGYEFYLSDYVSELNRISEQYKLEIKDIRARRWDEITEMIKSEKGKVQNKEQIENVLTIETKQLATDQILYESLFFKYKLKLNAIKDIITALVQRIKEKQNEQEVSRKIQS
jgi:hypothetical protein